MGYVNDTHMSQFIPPSIFQHDTGTWTFNIFDNIVSNDKNAADEAFGTLIPIPIISNSIALKGAKLLNIKVFYKIATAAADAFADVVLLKNSLGVDDTAASGESVSISLDSGHDTDAKRLAVDDDHCMTITLDDPAWIDDGDVFWLNLGVDCAETTDFAFLGAVANFELRL